MSARESDATPSQRVLGLYSLLLLSGREYSLSQLAEMFGCTKQTVLRMADQVEAFCGMNLERSIKGGQRMYRIRAPRDRPRVSLSPEDIQQLLLCRDLVMHLLPKGTVQHLFEVISRTTVLLPDFDDREYALESFSTAKFKGVIDYTPHQGTIETLMQAIREGLTCRLVYQPAGGREAERRFAPVKLMAYREAMYVLGFKLEGTGPPGPEHARTLAVHRIRSTELLDEAIPEELPDPAEPGLFGFRMSETFRVKVKFAACVADYVCERQWSEDQKLTRQKNGKVVLEFSAQSEPEVVSWILGFGSTAELLAPRRLLKRLQAEVAALAQKYCPSEARAERAS